jgi:Ca2+-binding EF-hand superfamily protein
VAVLPASPHAPKEGFAENRRSVFAAAVFNAVWRAGGKKQVEPESWQSPRLGQPTARITRSFMLRFFTMAGLFGALVVLAGSAAADDPPVKGKGKGKGLFQRPEALFKKMDADGDGKISKDEFKDYMAKNGPRALRDKPELLDRAFDKADADGDGYLSMDEFKALVEKFRERMGGKGKPGAGPAAGAKALLEKPEVLFKKMDANGDGKVSKDEFKSFLAKNGPPMLRDKTELLDKLFDRLDTDGDGSLTMEEFKGFVDLIRERLKELRPNP